jgi:hypothetical protein
MPYNIGSRGSNGCSGYPVLKEDGEIMGCHNTRSEAEAQQRALYASENKSINEDDIHDIDEYMSKWNGVFSPVITKEKKPNYGNIIKPRKGEPSNKELYNRVKSEAKRKFDVYPSAVANAWVVAEYKRRGGTYK